MFSTHAVRYARCRQFQYEFHGKHVISPSLQAGAVETCAACGSDVMQIARIKFRASISQSLKKEISEPVDTAQELLKALDQRRKAQKGGHS